MAASSQYYSVTAYTGVPHNHEVEVTVPLVGPQGPAGADGTGFQTVRLEVDSTNSASPSSVGLTGTVDAAGNLRAFVLVESNVTGGYARVELPQLAGAYAIGEVVIKLNFFEDGAAPCNVRVTVADQNVTAIYPATGYDEFIEDKHYVFRWNGIRWDMDPLANEAATTSFELLKPNHGGTLAAFTAMGSGVPATPTATGKPGMLAWGYADGIERLYICVANNIWRRVAISRWT